MILYFWVVIMKMKFKSNIGQQIVKLRHEHGVTQQELAFKLDITIACLSRYENNRRVVKTATLEKIANIFNVDANYFFDYTNSNVVASDETETHERQLGKVVLILAQQPQGVIDDVLRYAELLVFKNDMLKEKK
jgi:transcriptional regulator with XRE-family HTH domain